MLTTIIVAAILITGNVSIGIPRRVCSTTAKPGCELKTSPDDDGKISIPTKNVDEAESHWTGLQTWQIYTTTYRLDDVQKARFTNIQN